MSRAAEPDRQLPVLPSMWLFAFVPMIVSAIGGTYAVLRPPGPKLTSAVQHLAAGVVFAAAAAELLPDAIQRGTIWPVVAGAIVGVLVMLGLRSIERFARGPTGLIGAAAIDALIDGMVLGLGFAAGQKQGLLLAIALAVEFLFLAVSIAADFQKSAPRLLVLGSTIGVSAMVPLGTLIAIPIVGTSTWFQTSAYAFGLIALLYWSWRSSWLRPMKLRIRHG